MPLRRGGGLRQRLHHSHFVPEFVSGMSKRSFLIVALLVAIVGCTITVVLQGEGDYLLQVLVAIGLWFLVGLLLMVRWAISLQFWGAVGSWLRRLWR
jgi:hypothetical protein